jgi:hypothetical protein
VIHYIATNAKRVPTKLFCQCGGPVGIAISYHHSSSLHKKTLHNRFSDSAAASGHDRNLVR